MVKNLNKVVIDNINVLNFVIFAIENTAIKLKIHPKTLYALLMEKNIIYDYIVLEYEILHTQSKDYIEDDIIDFMKSKGINL